MPEANSWVQAAEAQHPAVFIETHGCKLNQADAQILARRFVQAGYRLAEEPAQADVHVVNTCTVTHVADRKARHALREARRRNPGAVVVATGCYAQRAPQQLAQLAEVNLVLGNSQKDALVDRVSRVLRPPEVPCSTGRPETLESSRWMRTRAMIKIQEGCNQVCAYCIVPKVRGRERSIPPEALVAQVRQLVCDGHQEVVLTGTQLGSYGFDIQGASLAGLVRQLLEQTTVPRLRVSSLQPQEITPELLALWRDPRLCPHFHLPLQSGSAAVLKAMRRRYTPQRYLQAVESIREGVPRAAITADVIVGFPGETEERFQETYELCKLVGFAGLHVFQYSTRPGTTAAYLQPKVGDREKRTRMDEMLALAKAQAQTYRRGLLGSIRTVLWETSRFAAGVQVWSGLTDNYARVATVSDALLHNRITPFLMDRLEREVVWGTVPCAD